MNHSFKVANTLKVLERRNRRIENINIRPDKIYEPCGSHLGDIWSFVSLVMKYRIKTISTRGYIDTGRKFREIIPLFEGKHRPTIIDRHPDVKRARSFGHAYAKTKIQWKRAFYGRVCYQFDGRSNSSNKNIPKQREEDILNCFDYLHVDSTKLGKDLTLLDCVRVAATSDFFVGVESGMSHLCHSVGVPTIIIASNLTRDHVETYHAPNKYELYDADSTLFARISKITRENGLAVRNGRLEDKRSNRKTSVYSRPPSLCQAPSDKPRYRFVGV